MNNSKMREIVRQSDSIFLKYDFPSCLQGTQYFLNPFTYDNPWAQQSYFVGSKQNKVITWQ